MVPSGAFVLLSIISAVYAKNNWSVPCWDGVCEYDNAFGGMKIWGSPQAISDITTAGGWTILDCNSTAIEQDIRLVCHNANGCPHLTTGGAVNTLVRLPENCGANAFARVARMWVHEDQSIPPEVARRLVGRDDAATPANAVQGMQLDVSFADVDPSANGNVSIAVQGSNVPSATGDASITDATPPTKRYNRFSRRGLFSFIEDAFKKFDTFDKTITSTLPPLDFDKSINLFDQKLDCPASGDIPALSAEVKSDIDAKAHAVISVGVAVTGTIVPPILTGAGVFAGMDASVTGTLTLTGSAGAKADSGKITVFETSLAGLDFPGILTLGPSFKIDAQASGTLDVGISTKVSLNYNVNGAKLFFPPSDSHASGGGFNPADSPLSLSITPGASSKASITGHVIPTLTLGLNALGGAATANVFLDLDASATAALTLDTTVTAPAPAGQDVTANLNGCADFSAGLGVNAGADAAFFNLFDTSKQVNIFQKYFDLFKKCFGNAATRRSFTRRVAQSEWQPALSKRFDLTCSTTGNFGNIASLIDEPVPSASITAA